MENNHQYVARKFKGGRVKVEAHFQLQPIY
jgi:hypothetical protein